MLKQERSLFVSMARYAEHTNRRLEHCLLRGAVHVVAACALHPLFKHWMVRVLSQLRLYPPVAPKTQLGDALTKHWRCLRLLVNRMAVGAGYALPSVRGGKPFRLPYIVLVAAKAHTALLFRSKCAHLHNGFAIALRMRFARTVAFLATLARFFSTFRQKILAVALFFPQPGKLSVAGNAHLGTGKLIFLGRGRTPGRLQGRNCRNRNACQNHRQARFT
jgi:hypothetical protein